MAWSIEGRYFENCSCEVVCPCTASLALGGGGKAGFLHKFAWSA